MSKKIKDKSKEDELFPLPEYSPKDDIYSKDEETDIDPDTNTTKKGSKRDSPDDGLDIPGSELDDEDEAIGEEDEENNYYSLGGDDHDDLEDDKADDMVD